MSWKPKVSMMVYFRAWVLSFVSVSPLATSSAIARDLVLTVVPPGGL